MAATEKKTQVISIRFTPEMFNMIKEFSEADRRTINSTVEAACLDYIRRNRRRVRPTEKAAAQEP
jgi:hypothetical protein